MKMSNDVESNSRNIFKYLAGFSSKLICNHKGTICITSHDGKEWNLVNCMFQLLQELQYNQNSLIATIEEIITNYHAKYHSGCKAVIFLGHCILQELIGLKNMNYDVAMISSIMSECIEDELADEAKKFSKCFNITNLNILKHVFYNLTKGYDIQIRDGLLEICQIQNKNVTKNGSMIRFTLRNVIFLIISGSVKFRLQLYNGILIRPGRNFWTDTISRRAVLFDGSMMESHRHVGHKAPQNLIVVNSFELPSSDEAKNNCEPKIWIADIFSIVEKNNVNTILVSGNVDPYFLELCENKYKVTCLSHVPLNVLNLISIEMESNVLNSFVDDIIGEQYILNDIKIDKEIIQGAVYYRIHFLARDNVFQSVVFHHVTDQWAKVKEEEFVHCAKNLEFSLKEPSNCNVVDGTGKIEKDMADFLNNKADEAEKLWANHPQSFQSDSILLRQILIRRSMADVFLKYRNVVVNNLKWTFDDSTIEDNLFTGSTFLEPSSYDNLEIKLATWRTAIYMANLFLRIDCDILRSEF